jgi:hypothetical protein
LRMLGTVAPRSSPWLSSNCWGRRLTAGGPGVCNDCTGAGQPHVLSGWCPKTAATPVGSPPGPTFSGGVAPNGGPTGRSLDRPHARRDIPNE